MIVLTPQLLIIVSWLCGIICRLEQRQNPIRERVFFPSEELFPGAAGGYLCWNSRCEQLPDPSSAGAGPRAASAAWCAIGPSAGLRFQPNLRALPRIHL